MAFMRKLIISRILALRVKTCGVTYAGFVVIFVQSFECFAVSICDLVHVVETLHCLYQLLTEYGNLF